MSTQPTTGPTTEPVAAVTEVPIEVDGVGFTLRVFPDHSGLRGQVFHGEEKIAGVQVFHTTDLAQLQDRVHRDRAVARAVARLREQG